MQGFTLTAIIGTEETYFDVKIYKVSGPCNIGQGHRVKVRA